MSYLKSIAMMACLLFCFVPTYAQQSVNVKKIERMNTATIDSAYATSVQISIYDTVAKKLIPGVFGGVVVSAEGHVLSVAHVVKPSQLYQIAFTDGTKYMAKGLGRIAIKGKDERKNLDLAIIKILTPGTWRYAKMAPRSSMRVGQPCISISSPASFQKKEPNIRYGRITDIDTTNTFFISTCKMEPGDSGGPLYDALGRVIGIHSWITIDEEKNYEIPVELFRKYWSALNKPIDYQQLPVENGLVALPTTAPIPTMQDPDQFLKIPNKLHQSLLSITSKKEGSTLQILGTIINHPKTEKKITYVISKSSMVGDDPTIAINNKNIPAEVVGRSIGDDLILLKIAQVLPNGIKLRSTQDSITLTMKDLGKFLVSPITDSTKKVGVISTWYISTPIRYSQAYFGANAAFTEQKILITDVAKRSGSDGVIQIKDQIVKINGIEIAKPEQFGNELSKYMAGDIITIDLVREGTHKQVKITLPAYPTSGHPTWRFAGGRSLRSDGFKKIFVQDATIKATECGGPVFDADGNFYGINIARHSRTSTIVMPKDVISTFVQQFLKL